MPQTFMYLLRQARDSAIGPEYPRERPKPDTRSVTLEDYFRELGRRPSMSGVGTHAWPEARAIWKDRPEHDPTIKASLRRVLDRAFAKGEAIPAATIDLARKAFGPTLGRVMPKIPFLEDGIRVLTPEEARGLISDLT